MSVKHLYLLFCLIGIVISVFDLFGVAQNYYEHHDVGASLVTVVNPAYHSGFLIAIGLGLLIFGIGAFLESDFSKVSGLMIAVSVSSIVAGIARYHSYDPAVGSSWIDGLDCVIYLVGIALAVNLKSSEHKSSTPSKAFMLLIGMAFLSFPQAINAQSFIEADAQYGQNGLWPRISAHINVPSEGEIRFLTVGEFTYQEALLMQGTTWETGIGDIGFVIGGFIEATHEESENFDEGATALGFGAMCVYGFEKEVFHLLIETGAGWNFHSIVPLYDIRTWWLWEAFSFGGRAHYELGYGPTLGYQLGEHWLLNASGFVKEHRTPTYLAGIAYCIGTNRH